MSVESGRVLGERYRLIELVAAGGMGDVWRANDFGTSTTACIGYPLAENADFGHSMKRQKL